VLGPQPRLGRVAALEYTVLDGSKHTTAQWQGRVTLVNFWATTCAECLREMPRLLDTHQRYRGQGLDVVAVAMRHDPPAFVLDYANKRALPFAVAFDPLGEMARGFDNTAVTPTMFVVNRRGEIVRRYVGTPDFAQLHGLIEELLAQPG
jgi:thiol-disulfide isomerase/thioredoxin